MTRVARRNQVKTEKKLVNVWFFELVQYGKSSWTILGLPRVLNTVEKPVWLMVYGFEIIEYGRLLTPPHGMS